ncbi:MAG: ferritin-like domain-containing protein [Clostridium sp.]|uniref:ferritin-like domain-containing protein n=1 Tax=Clostridium sp. TaxID=1506 RepID=UPI003057BA73
MDTTNIICKHNSPYPEIICENKNKEYAHILQINYAGIISELTSINQYLYHSFTVYKNSKELSEILESIANVEITHLKLLGNMIIELGGDPLFCINKGSKQLNWTPKFIEYGSSLGCKLREDIDGEKATIRQYENTIKLIKDENITAVIKRIIKDEEVHVKLLTSLLNKYCRR